MATPIVDHADIAIALISAVLAIVWRAGLTLGRIEARLYELATNHLPHLETEIHELRERLDHIVNHWEH